MSTKKSQRQQKVTTQTKTVDKCVEETYNVHTDNKSEVRRMKEILKKLTEYCDRGRIYQNFVSFTAGLIISMTYIVIKTILIYIN